MDPIAVREELKRVLASPLFVSSNRLARFLHYVVEETLSGRAETIKEYAIGLSAYGKPASYNPKVDATVRSEAIRLRAKLREYYGRAGMSHGAVRIEIPKGTYVPSFIPSGEDDAAAADGASAIHCIAVLPFRPLSGGVKEESQSLGLAIADALITAIAASKEILVRATSSVRKYIDSEIDAIEAARELQVEAIVEGYFQRAGDRLRVSVQLLRASDGRHILAESCDGVLPDIFSLQDHLAAALTRALGLKRPDTNVPALTHRRTTRPECYSQYAIGRFHFLRAAPDATPKAVAAFRAAIAADPGFAPAHAQLAFALSQTADLFLTTYPQVCEAMSTAADSAMALDPSSPEAVAALALVQQRCRWQWLDAAAGFDRALALQPASAEIYVYAARLLDALGDGEQAAALCATALDLDPASSFAHLWLSFSEWFQRRYHESISWARKALDIDPHNPIAMGRLMEAHYVLGNYGEWAALLKRTLPFWGVSTMGAELENTLQKGGREGLLRHYLGLSRAEPHGNHAWWLAFYHSEAGDLSSAFACLDRAYDDRASMLAYLKVDPRWDRIRVDPRFQHLVHRVGIP